MQQDHSAEPYEPSVYMSCNSPSSLESQRYIVLQVYRGMKIVDYQTVHVC